MKVGLPRALLFYYYDPLWQAFFHALDIETVTSGATTPHIVDNGVRNSVAEICVPIKIFCGHVVELLATDVDVVFIPRMITVEERKHFCPKFLGLPDMMLYTVPGLEGRLLDPDIRCRQESLEDTQDYESIAKMLGKKGRDVKQAFAAAKSQWEVFRRYHLSGMNIDEAMAALYKTAAPVYPPSTTEKRLKIGLLGYVYNIYDSFVGMDIIKKLRMMGADVVTFEMLDDGPIKEKLHRFSKTMPWTFTNKLLGAGYNFYEDPEIDGMIHVTAFGCGPDSMLGRLLEFMAVDYNKPFMTVRVDEHTGEAHLSTRVEAFTDMLRRKKYPVR
jgi:predicted nucleotide-binding protein (sugar kinase/HSP70/actin superfamily)